VIAVCALAAALVAAPAAASACPSYAHVKSFSGTASESFAASASGDDGIGGTATVSVSHLASGLKSSMTRVSAEPNAFQGLTSSGSITVSDAFSDPAQMQSGAQNAGGASKPGIAHSTLGLVPGTCTYVVAVGFGIATASSGNWPNNGPGLFTPDLGVTGSAVSPPEPIPAGLKLSGTATVDVYDGAAPQGKGYYLPAGLGARDQWEAELRDLSAATTDQPYATATFSWSFTPNFSNKHKHKKHRHPKLCLVPKLTGKTVAAAKQALKKARCSVGKVTKHTSSKVPKGRIISSGPKAGSKRKAGTKVALTVSRGKH
jgi:hypothetical protein